MKKFYSILFLSLIVFIGGASLALAQPEIITKATDVTSLAEKIKTYLYAIFLTLAVIFLLLAAFYYLTAGGDEDKLKKAKDYLKYAIIGIIIALLAGGMVKLIETFLRGQTS